MSDMIRITHRDLMLSTRGKTFSRPDWIFELKYDGFRVLAIKEGDTARLLTRAGNNLAKRFPEVVASLLELPDLVLDGELVVLDERGFTQFEALRRRALITRFVTAAAARTPAAIIAFDLLTLRGEDLRALPLLKRKKRLERLLKKKAGRISYATHVEGDGMALYAAVEQAGAEGIVAKRAGSSYRAGRTHDWLKIKTPAASDTERRRRARR